MNKKTYALVDCNCFYVSCERLLDPKLHNRPVVVHGGIVTALSQEAKDIGINRGDPFFKIKALLDKHGGVGLSSNFSLYGDISRRVMSSLRLFTDRMQIYSVDEAFLDISNLNNSELLETASQIKSHIESCVGIPVSVGIGRSKVQAKLANHISKTEFNGVAQIKTLDVLKKIDVGSIWGIGKSTRLLLSSLGIKTAWDLAWFPNDSLLQKKTSINVIAIKRELQGESCLSLDGPPASSEQISSSRSFEKPLTDLSSLQQSVSIRVETVAHKLRAQKSVCGSLSVYVRTSVHAKDDFYSNMASAVFPPTSDSIELNRQAMKLLERLFRQGYKYKKSGVVVDKITSRGGRQMDLFDAGSSVEREQLMTTIDLINSKVGRGSVRLASTPVESFSKRECSPNYTSSWDELPHCC